MEKNSSQIEFWRPVFKNLVAKLKGDRNITTYEFNLICAMASIARELDINLYEDCIFNDDDFMSKLSQYENQTKYKDTNLLFSDDLILRVQKILKSDKQLGTIHGATLSWVIANVY